MTPAHLVARFIAAGCSFVAMCLIIWICTLRMLKYIGKGTLSMMGNIIPYWCTTPVNSIHAGDITNNLFQWWCCINSIAITVPIRYSHGQEYIRITAVIVLLLCNWYSCYSLGQILYYYQLITHFNSRTIRAATVLLHVFVQPNSTHYCSCYYWPYSYK